MHRAFLRASKRSSLTGLSVRPGRIQLNTLLCSRQLSRAGARYSRTAQVLNTDTYYTLRWVDSTRARTLQYRIAYQFKGRESLTGSLWQQRQRHGRGLQYTTAISSSKSTQALPWNQVPVKKLAAGEVHVWWLFADEVNSPTLLEQYLDLLSPAEQEHVAQGANPAVRKERLLARVLVRTVLARYQSELASPAVLNFENNAHGKPSLVTAKGCDIDSGQLHFNLTHTESLLGCAVTRGVQVGLDVEDSRRLTRSDPLKLARRRFSPTELASLEGTGSAEERACLFMRLWTLKESYVKATGRGINAKPGLKAFSFQLLDSRADEQLPNGSPIQQASKQETARKPVSGSKENIPPERHKASAPMVPSVQADGCVAVAKSGATTAVAQGSTGVQRGRITDQWGADGTIPFRISFQPPADEQTSWRAILMEVAGDHTAALCVEAPPQSNDAADFGTTAGLSDARESIKDLKDGAVRLTTFRVVPLVSEEVWTRNAWRVLATS